MIKHSIRIAGFILAVFSLVLVFKHSCATQKEKPLGTTEGFELIQVFGDKDRMINELNAMADQYHAVLVKIVPNQDDYQNQTDIIWFGSQKPNGDNPRIKDNRISWLAPSACGELIHSSGMGTRALHGSYAMNGNAEFRSALTEWCRQNEIPMEFHKQESLPVEVFRYLFWLGVGNAVLIACFLLLTTFVVWFATHARTRALRLLGGISPRHIHFEDTLTLLSLASQGFFPGCAAFFIYLSIASGMDQVSLMILPYIYAAIAFIAGSTIAALLMSFFVRPLAKHLSFRMIPLKQFRLLGRVCLILSLLLALIVVPSTINMASAYKALSNDYASQESLKDFVSISFNDVDGLYNDTWMPKVEDLFEEMATNDNLCLSMAIDRAILLDKEVMGKYDHVVVMDRAWLKASGMSNSDENDTLVPIGLDDMHKELRDVLSSQLSIWTNTGEAQPEGMGFFEFSGDSLLVLPPNASSGEGVMQAKNPLIILVDDAVRTLRIDRFLLPMASSGNVVFKNEAVLRAALARSPILEKISHIDSFTEGALQSAQRFREESFYYYAACILCLISMGAAGILSAQLWIGENRKRIFTLHTAGNKYATIIMPALRKEIMIAACTTFAGGLIAEAIKRPGWPLLLSSAAALFMLYVLLNYVGYEFFSKREFRKIICRRA